MMKANDSDQHEYAAFVAIDWADQKHVFTLQETHQAKKENGTLEQKPEVIGPWVAKLQERFPGQRLAVGVEQSRGALIHALLEYDFLVIYPIHPSTVAKFRQAFKASGAKNDPLDTDLILEILSKHLGLLKALNPDTVQTRLLARLTHDRRKTVDLRTSHVEALTASLKEYFPQALALVNGNLTSRLAGDFLMKWPTLEQVQQAKPNTLKKFYLGHNIRRPELIKEMLALAQAARPLTKDLALVESGRRLTQMHAQMIQTLNSVIADYEARIKEVFEQHPEAHLFRQIPGAGPAMAPRLLAFFGTDRSRFASAQDVQSFSGIGPVTVSSGKSRVVHFRRACPKFLRQTFHEFARLSTADCQWAQNYVEYYRSKGKKYSTVIRALAFKWIRILFRCWQDKTSYDDQKHMETLKKRGSIFATLHLKSEP